MAISPTAFSTAAVTTADRVPLRSMAQDDFLKVLIAQMTSQDPLNPVKDADFLSQMAQFTSLEQTRAMGSELAQLRSDQERIEASALLGHTVATKGKGDEILTGVVDAIVLENGAPRLVVNDQVYSISEVIRVSRNSTQQQDLA